MAEEIRLLLVDDHAVVRAGLRALLAAQQGMAVVGEAGDGATALELAGQLQPHVVLMDLGMRGMSGLETTAAMVAAGSGARVLILTMHEDEAYFFHAIRAGAAGYILKEAAPDELVAAIRAVHQGGFYFHPNLTRHLVTHLLEHASQPPGQLSERERSVLCLIADGSTTREIAAALFISPRTVERHRTSIMEKLNLHNRAELIRYAIGRGLIKPG